MQPRIAGRLIAAHRRSAPTCGAGHRTAIVTLAPTPSRFDLVPSRLNRMKWPALFRAVVQVNQRFILVEHDGIETPVVIEVADRQTPTEVQLLERLSSPVRDVGQMTARPADHELQRHRPGESVAVNR